MQRGEAFRHLLSVSHLIFIFSLSPTTAFPRYFLFFSSFCPAPAPFGRCLTSQGFSFCLFYYMGWIKAQGKAREFYVHEKRPWTPPALPIMELRNLVMGVGKR